MRISMRRRDAGLTHVKVCTAIYLKSVLDQEHYADAARFGTQIGNSGK